MKTIVISIRIFLFFTVLTGIMYPLIVTAFAQLALPYEANGSLIYKKNQLIGSELIGQQTDSIIYFSSRPSAIEYNSLPSGGSNLGPTNAKLKMQVTERLQHFIQINGLDEDTNVPSEMLFTSASGLDPHISPEAAILQINRVATARKLSSHQKLKLKKLIPEITESPQWGCLGKARINVLLLNLRLDEIK